MSIKCMNYVWTQSETTGSDRLVLLALADSCNDDGEWSPGVTRLAKKCRLGERQTQKVLRNLEEMGEIEVLYNQGVRTKTGRTNHYRMKRFQLLEGVNCTTPLVAEGVNCTTPLVAEGVNCTTPKSSVNKPPVTTSHALRATVEGEEVPSNTQQPPTTPPIAPPPSSPPKRKRAAAHPFTQAVMGAYLAVHGEKGVNREAEGAWAKKIAAEHEERGAEGCGEITSGCYLWIKSDPWWQYKTVGLAQVYKRMPDYLAWLDNKGIQAQSRNRNDNISYATALAHQQIPDYIREMMEE